MKLDIGGFFSAVRKEVSRRRVANAMLHDLKVFMTYYCGTSPSKNTRDVFMYIHFARGKRPTFAYAYKVLMNSIRQDLKSLCIRCQNSPGSDPCDDMMSIVESIVKLTVLSTTCRSEKSHE